MEVPFALALTCFTIKDPVITLPDSASGREACLKIRDLLVQNNFWGSDFHLIQYLKFYKLGNAKIEYTFLKVPYNLALALLLSTHQSEPAYWLVSAINT
jgi:hypothetical protein